MINKVKFSKARCALLGMVSALVLFSEVSMAGTYHSAVNFPRLHSAGQVHRVNIPFSSNAPDRIKVRDVSWNWTQPSIH
ncbi:MAG: hypothetical protein JWQ69_4567 [Pseudomonas sp.]|nr:hypothetical protein [Pseudomonas sp.]